MVLVFIAWLRQAQPPCAWACRIDNAGDFDSAQSPCYYISVPEPVWRQLILILFSGPSSNHRVKFIKMFGAWACRRHILISHLCDFFDSHPQSPVLYLFEGFTLGCLSCCRRYIFIHPTCNFVPAQPPPILPVSPNKEIVSKFVKLSKLIVINFLVFWFST